MAPVDQLVGMIVHDSYHADQQRRSVMDVGIDAERAASRFALDVTKRLGLSESVIDIYRRDADTGHKPAKSDPKVKQPKKSKH